jgi:hypothetical protein
MPANRRLFRISVKLNIPDPAITSDFDTLTLPSLSQVVNSTGTGDASRFITANEDLKLPPLTVEAISSFVAPL